jgi:predicted ATPase
LDAITLQRELRRLSEAEIVYQRGVPPHATYVFKHALIQDAAYASLLKSTRQQYHQRIAQTLVAQLPETADSQPELLAHHYTEAGLIEQSIAYWYKAGQRASERSAHVEAISHLTRGLELLETLPEIPQRLQREVDMLIALGASLIATKGSAAPEVGQTYTRARQLCQDLADPHQLFPVLRGLWNYALVRAELQTAHALSEQLLTLAQQTQDPVMLSAAHGAVGTTLLSSGAAADAFTHLTQEIALYDLGAWGLWCLGSPDQALVRSHEAVTLAQQIAYPFSLSFALGSAAMIHHLRREERFTQERAEATMSLTKEQGFQFWMALGSLLHGWTLVRYGQAQEGIAQISQGLTAYHATGAEILRPYCLALLAEAHGIQGEPEAGLVVLAEALTLTDTTGERWSEPELYRLKGELLLQQNSDNQAEAEHCFHHAISRAQNQSAKSWELRAATSLARLWQQQGKRQEAHDLLAPIYHWFTEGFDTADLQDAKTLLDELA